MSDDELHVDLLADLHTGEWLQEQEFPPLQWMVQGIIPEGLSLLVGSPKAGKSWLIYDTLMAIAEGSTALGCIPVKQRPTLYLALEDGDRRLQGRARYLGRDPIPPEFQYLTRVVPGTIVPTIEQWLDRLGNFTQPPIVAIDTLGKVMPPARGSESAFAHDYAVMGRLKDIADSWPGMSIVVIHHTRKMASDDFVDAANGTRGLTGAADAVISLTRRRGEDHGLLQVTGRDVVENTYRAEVNDWHWSLTGGSLDAAAQAAETAEQTETLGDRSTEVIKYLVRRGSPATAAQVGAGVGIDSAQARVYLNRLHSSERIRRSGRGQWVPVTNTVTSVTSVTDDIDGGDERNSQRNSERNNSDESNPPDYGIHGERNTRNRRNTHPSGTLLKFPGPDDGGAA